MDILPDKPSELLKVALEDLEKCEKDPKYKINMENYHVPEIHEFIGNGGNIEVFTEKCRVCAAGAVMAKHLSLSPHVFVSPESFDISVERKLEAIDCFRTGNWVDAFRALRIRAPIRLLGLYDEDEFMDLDNLSQRNRKQWKNYMLDAIGVLEAEGL